MAGRATENYYVQTNNVNGFEYVMLKNRRPGDGSIEELNRAFDLLSPTRRASIVKSELFAVIGEAHEGIRDAVESGCIILGDGRKIDQKQVGQMLPDFAPLLFDAHIEGTAKTTVEEFVRVYGPSLIDIVQVDDVEDGQEEATVVRVISPSPITSFKQLSGMESSQREPDPRTYLYLIPPRVIENITGGFDIDTLEWLRSTQSISRDLFNALVAYVRRVLKDHHISGSPIPAEVLVNASLSTLFGERDKELEQILDDLE